MPSLCFLLGDQLSQSLLALQQIDKKKDIVFLCEVMEEATYVTHHPQKIAFIFSAMRHFAQELREEGYTVRYTTLDDPQNTQSFDHELARVIKEEHINHVFLTEPGEWRVLQKCLAWQHDLSIPVTIHPDNRFLCSIAEFRNWAKDKKQWRMEYFYRDMRKKHQLLIDENRNPVGGQWNYDAENRKVPKTTLDLPKRINHPYDSITLDVLDLVKRMFNHHFGDLELFDMAINRQSALHEAEHFIHYFLPCFGDYQDAMLHNEVYLYHSRLSFYLNAGLLLPLELCRLAEAAYYRQHACLNSVEGFIRQILGWREYVRGVYWLSMPDYAQLNYFSAQNALPAFYWGASTKMSCVAEAVRHTKEHAYSHHIQRLMITGNFALLAGINPALVCEWYLAVYADAYEWVELPNTLGMALYADGGLMASKPYAASGKYIQRMSNFCQSCVYDPKETIGDKACPFNALYWDFMQRNRDKLKQNQRLVYAYLNWDKMTEEKQTAIKMQAALIIEKMNEGLL